MISKNRGSLRIVISNIVLISNAFIWYSFAFNVLKGMVDTLILPWIIHFSAIIFSGISGAMLSERIHKKETFLLFWIIFGVICSLFLVFADLTTVLVPSFLFGISFGLGVPASLEYFAKSTTFENRGKLGGLILCVNGVGIFLLSLVTAENLALNAFILTTWRTIGLIAFLLVKFPQEIRTISPVSFRRILSQRIFFLYFIPWFMFSLVNYLSFPIQVNILGSGTANSLCIIESFLASLFSIIGGCLSDAIGRKRVTIFGFIILGLGYAILGIYPENIFSWYLYTVVDGAAWGIFYVIFVFTIWADISQSLCSEKYYALAGTSLFLSNFLRISVGSYISQTFSPYAIFSFVALFLFLAVIPLMYAPETLPEKLIRRRELRKYIEKAKKIREKYEKEED